MAGWPWLFFAVPLLTGCKPRLPETPRGPVDSPDRSAHKTPLTQSGPMDKKTAATLAEKGSLDEQRADIRRLFEATTDCGDRYHCPPHDRLLDLAARPGDRLVMEVLLTLVEEGNETLMRRLHWVLPNVFSNWLSRQKGQHALDPPAVRKELAARFRALIDKDVAFYRPMMFTAIGSLASYPDEEGAAARAYSMAALEDGTKLRDDEAQRALVKLMASLHTDYSLVWQWLRSDKPHLWVAALIALGELDKRKVPGMTLAQALAEESKVLHTAIKKQPLTAALAHEIIHLIDLAEERSYEPLIEKLRTHEDDDVRKAVGRVRRKLFNLAE